MGLDVRVGEGPCPCQNSMRLRAKNIARQMDEVSLLILGYSLLTNVDNNKIASREKMIARIELRLDLHHRLLQCRHNATYQLEIYEQPLGPR